MSIATWVPFYWEPVSGTNERIMAGVVVHFEGDTTAHRILRDDVIDAMFGKASGAPKNLIDTALRMARALAGPKNEMRHLSMPVLGLFPGPARAAEATTLSEAVRMAALMFSSLANLDHIDDIEAEDAPSQEDTNRRLSTEVRQIVIARRPDLSQYFNRSAKIVAGGENIKMGFLSARTAIHYGVLHPARQSSSVKDARSRFFELSRVAEYCGLGDASLIIAVPRADDPTLGRKQLEHITRNTLELTREAQTVHVNLRTVHSADEAAEQTEALA